MKYSKLFVIFWLVEANIMSAVVQNVLLPDYFRVWHYLMAFDTTQ